jgi:hypothetical protein
MLLGALVDAGVPFEDLAQGLKELPVQGYHLTKRLVRRGALRAMKVDVNVQKGFERPLPLARIRRLLTASGLPAPVKERARETFDHLGRAEAHVHGVSLDKVHFHEIGVVDSLVDVAGTLLGCHLLGASRVTASPVNVGSGTIATAHGVLPVPGPAVAWLSRGVPVYSDGPRRELATPTGMALLRCLVEEFLPLPRMTPTAVGYGAGATDCGEWPNVLRVFVGESGLQQEGAADTVVQLETNVDDLTPQAYEFVMDRLFKAGALDATLTPVIMKRGRPGVTLTALAPREKAETVLNVIFSETTALGVRVLEVPRRVLPRAFEAVHLKGGDVRIKVAKIGAGQAKVAPEFADCRRIAEQTGRPLKDVMQEALAAFSSHRRRNAKKSRS